MGPGAALDDADRTEEADLGGMTLRLSVRRRV